MMRVDVAQHPEAPEGQDRVHIAPNAVIVLDGATAFTSAPVDAGTYADGLGRRIADDLTDRPAADLVELLTSAIADTRDHLSLSPGESPSSTVSIVRVNKDDVDVLILGDSPIIVGHIDREPEVIVDDRLAHLPNPHRVEYRRRLAAGRGYDEQHRAMLRKMQAVQASQRNRTEGYYIAEADPDAARHAITRRYARAQVDWLILATDGASDLLQHLDLADWPALAADPTQSARLLREASDWEAHADPDGHQLPRAKRHDDKTIAVVALRPTLPS